MSARPRGALAGAVVGWLPSMVVVACQGWQWRAPARRLAGPSRRWAEQSPPLRRAPQAPSMMGSRLGTGRPSHPQRHRDTGCSSGCPRRLCIVGRGGARGRPCLVSTSRCSPRCGRGACGARGMLSKSVRWWPHTGCRGRRQLRQAAGDRCSVPPILPTCEIRPGMGRQRRPRTRRGMGGGSGRGRRPYSASKRSGRRRPQGALPSFRRQGCGRGSFGARRRLRKSAN